MSRILNRIFRSIVSCRPRLFLLLLRLLGKGELLKRVSIALIRPGDTVFDVGANVGRMTLQFSDSVGSGGIVHSFEPVAQTFARLEAEVLVRRLHRNVSLNRIACSDRAGEVLLQIPGSDTGQASLKSHSVGSWESVATISSSAAKAMTLDQYVEDHAINRCDFVKCDVEGAELLVLRGMPRVLERFRPLLLLEVCSDWMKDFGYDAAEMESVLRSAGYDQFFVLDSTIRECSDFVEVLKAEGSRDLLCCVRSLHSNRTALLSLV